MKKALLATAIAALTISNAWANNDGAHTDLIVKGKLLVGGCTPVINGGAVLDFGSHLVSGLSATAVNDIGTKTTNLVITCPSATKVGWTLTDNKTDSNADIWIGGIAKGVGTTYGVGKTAGGVKIGAYSVTIDDTAAASAQATNGEDSFNVSFIYGAAATADAGGNVGWAEVKDIASFKNQNDAQQIVTVAAKGTTDPVAYTSATYPLAVSLAVDNTTKLAITDDTDIEGSTTITLKYI